MNESIHLKDGTFIYIETSLGIINVRAGLKDSRGRKVDSVEVIPDRYVGERKVVRAGKANTRLIQLKRRA